MGWELEEVHLELVFAMVNEEVSLKDKCAWLKQCGFLDLDMTPV